MKPISYNCEGHNDYTIPLSGTPYYRRIGVIYAVDCSGRKYAVSRIDFERYDDQNFQYIFSPEWSVIDALPSSIFQGIPGIDLNLRRERYYRVNITPSFISDRTPSESREDIWELLGEVGLTYYDPFEWLIRTDMRASVDNLIVEDAKSRYVPYESLQNLPGNLCPSDYVVIDSFRNISETSHQLRKNFLKVLSCGANIWDKENGSMLSKEECHLLLNFLLLHERLEAKQTKQCRRDGIVNAKKAGKYTGRKKIKVDFNLLQQVASDFRDHKISEEEAMRRVGITSRSTFYRRLKEL